MVRTRIIWTVALAILIGTLWWGVQWFITIARNGERMVQGVYFVEGRTNDPELLRNMGLFSDAEVDALIAERDRRPDAQTPTGHKRITQTVAKILGFAVSEQPEP